MNEQGRQGNSTVFDGCERLAKEELGRAAEPARKPYHGGTTGVIEINHDQCIFDDCREDADGSLQARWPDGQVWRREVCLVHVARGIRSLQEFRGPDAGEPIITRVRWLTQPVTPTRTS
jgi:hypothetical protein